MQGVAPILVGRNLLECPSFSGVLVTISSRLFKTPPRWRRAFFLAPRLLSKPVSSWVYEQGSLTERLQQQYGKDFNVKVLMHEVRLPFAEEALKLGLRKGEKALVREVILRAGKEPLILARSIVPRATFLHADRRLLRLGNQPLGHVIFTHPELRRQDLEVATLPLCRELKGVPSGEGKLKTRGRRSLYTIGQNFPLLVSEFFLPALTR
jgi:chorismate--pyruvate lyase